VLQRTRIPLRRIKALFFPREVAVLAFDRRVFAQAEDRRVPVLERLRFLCILSSNLDEFYTVRVAGLKAQVAAEHGEEPTMHNVFMTYTGRSLDDDLDEESSEDEED